ncbi:MAG TPA: hypothetical protein VFG90_10870 [Nitrososphaeraceae archaeon]|nr:hypothetical protein [Nitrososphaeraceae archaeon]
MVLGELIEEESGKITGRRVIDVEGPKTESSFTMNGKWVGQDVTDIGTYWGVMREGTDAQGVVYGEAQGLATTKDGQGMATYKVQGIGRFTSPGKIRFHGSVFYHTTPTSGGKLSSLNNTVGVFEYEEDEQGNCSVKVWEWK